MTLFVTWLWQGLAIAAATVVGLACARTLNAATRHALWWTACAGVLCLPLAYVGLSHAGLSAATSAALPLHAAPDRLVVLLIVGWGLFAAAGLVRMALSVRSVGALKRSGQPVDAALASRLGGRRDDSRGARRPAELRISADTDGAFALGLGRPVILVSQALVDALDEGELEAVVLHEQAHLDRRDDWGQLLQAFVTAVAGWHPAVWLIGRRIALEREAACDDRVIARTQAAHEYARTLAQAAAVRSPEGSRIDRLAIPAAAVSRSLLWRRVRRLLDGRLDHATAPALGTRVAATVAMMLVLATAVRVPPIVAFTDLATLVPGVDPALWRPALRGPEVVALPRGIEAAAAHVQAARVRSGNRPTEVARSASAANVSPLTVVAELVLSPIGDPADAAPVSVLPLDERAGAVAAPPTQGYPAPWSTIGRTATAGAKGVAAGSATAGDRAKDTGVSIGHFFSRTGKRLAGAF